MHEPSAPGGVEWLGGTVMQVHVKTKSFRVVIKNDEDDERSWNQEIYSIADEGKEWRWPLQVPSSSRDQGIPSSATATPKGALISRELAQRIEEDDIVVGAHEHTEMVDLCVCAIAQGGCGRHFASQHAVKVHKGRGCKGAGRKTLSDGSAALDTSTHTHTFSDVIASARSRLVDSHAVNVGERERERENEHVHGGLASPRTADDFEVGEVVEAKSKRGRYYTGTIHKKYVHHESKATPQTHYRVRFDEFSLGSIEVEGCDVRECVGFEWCRPLVLERLCAGDKVEARYGYNQGGLLWYPALISRVREDGFYSVKYLDGDQEVKVRRQNICCTQDLKRSKEFNRTKIIDALPTVPHDCERLEMSANSAVLHLRKRRCGQGPLAQSTSTTLMHTAPEPATFSPLFAHSSPFPATFCVTPHGNLLQHNAMQCSTRALLQESAAGFPATLGVQSACVDTLQLETRKEKRRQQDFLHPQGSSKVATAKTAGSPPGAYQGLCINFETHDKRWLDEPLLSDETPLLSDETQEKPSGHELQDAQQPSLLQPAHVELEQELLGVLRTATHCNTLQQTTPVLPLRSATRQRLQLVLQHQHQHMMTAQNDEQYEQADAQEEVMATSETHGLTHTLVGGSPCNSTLPPPSHTHTSPTLISDLLEDGDLEREVGQQCSLNVMLQSIQLQCQLHVRRLSGGAGGVGGGGGRVDDGGGVGSDGGGGGGGEGTRVWLDGCWHEVEEGADCRSGQGGGHGYGCESDAVRCNVNVAQDVGRRLLRQGQPVARQMEEVPPIERELEEESMYKLTAQFKSLKHVRSSTDALNEERRVLEARVSAMESRLLHQHYSEEEEEGEEEGKSEMEMQQHEKEDQDSIEPVEEGRECVVCWSRKSVVALVPCGHVCLCQQCSALPECPMCRAPVSSYLRVYLH